MKTARFLSSGYPEDIQLKLSNWESQCLKSFSRLKLGCFLRGGSPSGISPRSLVESLECTFSRIRKALGLRDPHRSRNAENNFEIRKVFVRVENFELAAEQFENLEIEKRFGKFSSLES